jgi:ribosome-associated translation inhibitor RaiA
MNIEISSSDTFLTQEVREYIRRRLGNALSENATDIEQVQVWMVGLVLSDADEAQYCLINVKLTDGSLIACDGTDADLKTAVSHALERLSREVARNLRQRRKQPVEHIRGPAGSYRKVTETGHSTERL